MSYAQLSRDNIFTNYDSLTDPVNNIHFILEKHTTILVSEH